MSLQNSATGDSGMTGLGKGGAGLDSRRMIWWPATGVKTLAEAIDLSSHRSLVLPASACARRGRRTLAWVRSTLADRPIRRAADACAGWRDHGKAMRGC